MRSRDPKRQNRVTGAPGRWELWEAATGPGASGNKDQKMISEPGCWSGALFNWEPDLWGGVLVHWHLYVGGAGSGVREMTATEVEQDRGDGDSVRKQTGQGT